MRGNPGYVQHNIRKFKQTFNKLCYTDSSSQLCRLADLSSLDEKAKIARLKFLLEIINDKTLIDKADYLNKHTADY